MMLDSTFKCKHYLQRLANQNTEEVSKHQASHNQCKGHFPKHIRFIISVSPYLCLSRECPRERCLLPLVSLSEALERAAAPCLRSLDAPLLLDPLLSDRALLPQFSTCWFLSCLSSGDRDLTTLLLFLSRERDRDLDRRFFFVPMSARVYVGGPDSNASRK